MARSAADAAAVLGVIAGRDPQDPTTLLAPVPDYLGEPDRGITGLRIGFDERYCTDGIDPLVTRMIEDALAVLRGRGAVVTAIRLPGRFDPSGLPVGFQLVGPHLGEATLVRAGHAYQQHTAWHRRRPSLTPTP